MGRPDPMQQSKLDQALEAMPLGKDEIDLIPAPNIGPNAFELLRAYHDREYRDALGRWHVVIASSRIVEIESAVKAYREQSSNG